MSYLIYNNDGSILANLANGEVDTVSTCLTLVGKNVDNYGQYINNNFVRLLTNSASGNSPISPQIGQLWFNTANQKLTVYDGTSFKPTYGSTVSGTPVASAGTGDLWYDTVNSQLKLWNGETYKLVGPAVSGIYGKFGIEPPAVTIREDDTNIPQNVGLIHSFGNVVGLISTLSFSMRAADADTYLNTSTVTPIVQGTTFINDIDVKGDLYIKGDYYINNVKQFPNGQTLTATFDITPYGDPSVKLNVENGNIAIRNFLPLVFSTVTNVTYGDIQYPLNSVSKVVCSYFDGTGFTYSVRRFKLIVDPIHPSIRIWNWDNVYYNTSFSTVTNIVTL